MSDKKSDFLHTQQFRTAIFLLVLGIFIWACFLMMRPFLKILGWTAALTIITLPIHSFLNKKFKIKSKTLCALLSCLIIIILVVVPATFIFAGIAQEAIQLSQKIQVYLEGDSLRKFMDSGNTKFTRFFYKHIGQRLDLSELKLESNLLEMAKQISGFIGKQSFTIAKNVAVNIFSIFLIFLTTFFLLRDKDKLISFIKSFMPLSEEYAELALNKAAVTIRVTIYGWLIIGIIQGTLLGLGFWFLGLSSPVFWGGVTALLCFIPFVGAPAVWVPASIILLIKGLYWKAIILAVWGALVVSLVDNFLRPIIVGVSLHLHPMVVFFSIFGGLVIMGPLGLIMGPVILAVTLSLLEVFKYRLSEEGR